MQRSGSTRNVALLALIASCAAVFLTAIDQTVVVTALPQIITDLQLSALQLDRASWIVSGYLLGYVIVMPLMGRVSDLYGRQRVFVLCMIIFALGSLLCALAPALASVADLAFLQHLGIDVSSPALIWLIVARFIQAVGGGAVVPVAMAVAGDFYGVQHRGLALGLVGMVTEAGGALGPLYGALIVQYLGWPYIFFLNLPLVAILLFCIMRLIPAKTPALADGIVTAGASRRIDLPGALLLGASLLCLSLGLAQQAAQITPSALAASGSTPIQNNPWLIAAALIFLAGFIVLELSIERRGQAPLIALSLFKRPMFSATALMGLLIGAALIIAMVDIPIFFLTVFNQSVLESGLALLRLTALIPVGAILGGWLCARISCRWTAVLGLLPAILGFWLMSQWSAQINWTQVTVSTLLTGFGMGMVISPISSTAIHAARRDQLGMASSIITVLRMIGMILGIAGLTSWGLGRFRAEASTFRPPKGITILNPKYAELALHFVTNLEHEIYTSIFLAAGMLCLLALLPAFFLLGRKTSDPVMRNTDESIDRSDVAEDATNQDSRPESEASTIYGQREK